jgi:hypothetical protein
MSKKKLAGIIAVCAIAIIVAVVITRFSPITTPIPTYTLSVSVSPSGAGSVSPSGGEYESGEQVTLNATPASDYTFDYWDYATSGFTSTNPITITMNSNKTITAHFKVVESPPVVENRPPFIMQLVADSWSSVAGTNTMIGIDITCEASDPDGDTISFSWEANEGTITGTGREVQWLIPAEFGRYVIEVTVNDGKGGKSSASMTDDLESVQVIGNTCHTSGSRSFSYEGH